MRLDQASAPDASRQAPRKAVPTRELLAATTTLSPHNLGAASPLGCFSRRLPAKPRKGAVLHADKACSSATSLHEKTCGQRVCLQDRRRAGICAQSCHSASESKKNPASILLLSEQIPQKVWNNTTAAGTSFNDLRLSCVACAQCRHKRRREC